MTEFELKFAEETKNKYKGALRYISSEYEKNKDIILCLASADTPFLLLYVGNGQ